MLSIIQPDWIVLAAGAAFILGYLIINQVILRLLVGVGTILYIWYYIVALDDPRAAVATSVLMGVANLIGLAQIWFRKSKLAIPAPHRDIYYQFASLPPGDFGAIMKGVTRRVLTTDEQVTTEGEPVEKLVFVLSGSGPASKMGGVGLNCQRKFLSVKLPI